MQKVSTARVIRMARKIVSPLTQAPTWVSEVDAGNATRELRFSYRLLIPMEHQERVTAGLLQRWSHGESAAVETATTRLPPGLRLTGGILSKGDRFLLAYAAAALTGLQSRGIAGSTVVHISTAGLMDPELPIFVISQFQRHGVGMVGVTVTLSPRVRTTAPQRRYAS